MDDGTNDEPVAIDASAAVEVLIGALGKLEKRVKALEEMDALLYAALKMLGEVSGNNAKVLEVLTSVPPPTRPPRSSNN